LTGAGRWYHAPFAGFCDIEQRLCLALWNVMFGEYFHGDNGAALGASHQTGWSGLIADVIRRRYGLVRSIGDMITLVGRENQA
jgi:hypothetical protein